MPYDLPYLKERIRIKFEEDPQIDFRLDLFEGKIAGPRDGENPFQTIKGSRAQVDEQVKQFESAVDGDFTAFIRSSKSQNWDLAERIYISAKRSSQGLQGIGNVEQMIEKRVAEILERKKKEEELEELKEKLKKYGTLEGKIEILADRLLMRYLPSKPDGAQRAAIQGPQKKSEISDEDRNDYEKGFSVLVELFSPEEILALAAMLSEDPSLLSIVKNQVSNFLNSK